jgi:GNAT superfamily N-acetyltransferase
MHIRRAVSEDAEGIERVRVRGWQVGYRHVFPADELDALPLEWSRWAEPLGNPEPGRSCYVAEEDGRIVGWATVGPARDPDNRYGELWGLYVDPDYWARGIGRALLARAETELAQAWDEAVLWTLEDNPRTRRFYEAAGWRLDGITGVFDRLGVTAPLVHYAKRLKSSTSRP